MLPAIRRMTMKLPTFLLLSFFALHSLFSATSATAAPAKEIRVLVKSMEQVDAIMESAKNPFTLIWSRDSFASPENAQLMLDVLRLSQAWETWFLKRGDDVTGLKSHVRFVYVNPTNILSEDRRIELLGGWFKSHLDKNLMLAAHGDTLIENLPPEFAFAGPDLLGHFQKAFDRVTDFSWMMPLEMRMEDLGISVIENASPAASGKTCESLFRSPAKLRAL